MFRVNGRTYAERRFSAKLRECWATSDCWIDRGTEYYSLVDMPGSDSNGGIRPVRGAVCLKHWRLWQGDAAGAGL